jgi:V/A-type H+-transporting ATPase subunit E
MEISESTEAIRRKILSDAEKEAERLRAEARDKATEILNAAKERAKELREAELERRKKHIDETFRQRIAETKVDYHRRIQSFKARLIDDTFDKAREQLQKYVKKPAYPEILNNLIIEAGATLGGGELLVKLNETDKKRMTKAILKKLSKEIEDRTKTKTRIVLDEKTVKAIGGAVVSTADQKATIDNTFEARLERIKEEAKPELETILFR